MPGFTVLCCHILPCCCVFPCHPVTASQVTSDPTHQSSAADAKLRRQDSLKNGFYRNPAAPWAEEKVRSVLLFVRKWGGGGAEVTLMVPNTPKDSMTRRLTSVVGH